MAAAGQDPLPSCVRGRGVRVCGGDLGEGRGGRPELIGHQEKVGFLTSYVQFFKWVIFGLFLAKNIFSLGIFSFMESLDS